MCLSVATECHFVHLQNTTKSPPSLSFESNLPRRCCSCSAVTVVAVVVVG